jgi:processive 1,2-diacylglycerol beta-glucosyltransferase
MYKRKLPLPKILKEVTLLVPNSQQRILVLTGTLGDGHNQAARAIAEAAGRLHPDAVIRVVDFMQWTHPKTHSVGRFFYMQGVKGLPSLYGYLYRATRDENKLSGMFKQIRTYRSGRMLELLEEFRPSVVVSTFPPAAAAMSRLKTAGLTSAATVTVLTDYARHSYWLHPGTDQYIVGSEPIKRSLTELGIPAGAVTVTGMPVRFSFGRAYDRQELRSKHGLSPALPVILVMGGGDGLIGRSLLTLLESAEDMPPAQFVFVCGRNEKLRRQLEKRLEGIRGPHLIKVTGFIDYVHELMAAADVMVTKPGGLTVSEALSQELPMILFKPIPGQEQENSAYLTRLGAAVEARSKADLLRRLRQVIAEDALRARLRKNASLNKPEHGADLAVQAIIRLLAQRDEVAEASEALLQPGRLAAAHA